MSDREDAPLNRAAEVKELLTAALDLIIPFIASADQDAKIKHTGDQLYIPISGEAGNKSRGVLVESHSPEELEKLLNLKIPENVAEGERKKELVDTMNKVLRYSVNTWDQGFMDKLYGSTNAVGLVSELLLAALNTNAHVYQVSPALTLIEKHVTKFLAADIIGFPPSTCGGISQPGGSASNSTAIVIARNTLYPSTKTRGLEGRRFTLFTSAHGHYSLEKAAQMFGLGSDAVVSVPVDEEGKMIPTELERLVEESKNKGETPFFVNATAGTTVLGSFDPIPPISKICKSYNLWLHIDGSWGGGVLFSSTHRQSRLEGIELADSVAITPHKMLQVPMTCSFLLGRNMDTFWRSMTLPAGYLFHGAEDEGRSVDEIYDLADLTPQCGRRADSLKLYLSLTYYGLGHFSSLISHGFEMANYLLHLLQESGDFVIASPVPLQCWQVCFYYARGGKLGDDVEVNGRVTEGIVRGLVSRGWMVDFAPGERGRMFRVVVNGGSGKGAVEGLVRGIRDVAGELGY